MTVSKQAKRRRDGLIAGLVAAAVPMSVAALLASAELMAGAGAAGLSGPVSAGAVLDEMGTAGFEALSRSTRL